MSLSDKVKLYVRAEDGGGVEIIVQDGAFRTVAREYGFLEGDFDPGIYTVVGQAGNQSHRQMVVLEPGKGSVEVRIPQVKFSSPVPLQVTSQSHEYHQIAAEGNSRHLHATVGSGSAIFVAVREYSGDPPNPRYTANPLAGLVLLDANGGLLVDLQAVGSAEWGQPGKDPWGCCNIVLDAGFYRLRQQLPSGDAIDLGLVASHGWQTQVFAMIGTYGGQGTELLPDLLEF